MTTSELIWTTKFEKWGIFGGEGQVSSIKIFWSFELNDLLN